MRISLFTVAVLAAAASQASAQEFPSPSDDDANQITISCFRGPTKHVVWDRPNAVFLDDLRQLGYSRGQAKTIGDRVCRDEYGVENHDHMRAVLKEVMADTKPRRARR